MISVLNKCKSRKNIDKSTTVLAVNMLTVLSIYFSILVIRRLTKVSKDKFRKNYRLNPIIAFSWNSYDRIQ